MDGRAPRRAVVFALFWGAAHGRGYGGKRHPLREYQFGLWRAIEVARGEGWLVIVYHDGSVEHVLRRFRMHYPPTVLECVRVEVRSPALRNQRYLGCVFRLLAADHSNVDVFLSRDLDDRLDVDGLRLVERHWLKTARPALAHVQAEVYHTRRRGPHKPMYNLGWFGMRRDDARRTTTKRPTVAEALRRWAVDAGPNAFDHYTSDEDFLTDAWLTTRSAGGYWPPGGALQPLPSHPYRKSVRSTSVPGAYRRFVHRRVPRDWDNSGRDAVVLL